MAPRHRFGVLVILVAGLLFGAVYRQTFSIAPSQRVPSVKLQDWEVEVSEEEGPVGILCGGIVEGFLLMFFILGGCFEDVMVTFAGSSLSV
jgi:hypothetical protein